MTGTERVPRDPGPAGSYTAAGPDTDDYAAARAQAIFDAAPRTELADAAEFLQMLLRLPSPSPDPGTAPGRTR